MGQILGALLVSLFFVSIDRNKYLSKTYFPELSHLETLENADSILHFSEVEFLALMATSQSL